MASLATYLFEINMRETKWRRLQFQLPLIHHVLQEKPSLDPEGSNGRHERDLFIGRCNGVGPLGKANRMPS